MADTEEEQIEALKRWWKENGTTTVLAVAIVVAGFFGWRQWDASREASAAGASDIYQQIATLVNSGVSSEGELNEEERSTAIYLNEQLRDEYASSIYARFAALYMARLYVEEDDLVAAEAELSWILDNPGLGLMQDVDPTLYLATRARLSRVLLAQGDAERALNLLQQVDAGHYAATFAEIEGDAWLAMGDRDKAAEAYTRAAQDGVNTLLLELKMRDLGLRE